MNKRLRKKKFKEGLNLLLLTLPTCKSIALYTGNQPKWCHGCEFQGILDPETNKKYNLEIFVGKHRKFYNRSATK